ncbi:restriction endonuclease subunit S [Helicobacter pylori]|uniref:Type I restriction modification DNA specificity domain protein n=1 Tax=Helicobacter pylori R018c TaxID=1145110 RepID=K2KVU5_HELPX|nr:restriction endonuclease subunit S [Helicobacter pylori]EKE81725.1 type I restriction modification DNA specificity domain protein [Helicobacter pylori R018c]EKE96109.1 type I restriction modification DNA specificity domain protein [Helicobacter pylori R056a]
MIGPLSSQLNAIKWGEFKLGDLFEASNGDFDIQKRHINHKGEFVITAGLSNNGVLGQSDIKAKVFESHTITVDMFGCAFYRSFPYKMVTHARVFSLKPKFEINHKIGLFLSTLFFGYPKKFGYENMCSWAKIKNDKVILPLKPTAKTQTLKDIDFDFMEKFIAELEQCRLAELEAYLKATGLENTTLSSDEENALNVFNNSIGGNTPCGLTWQSFKIVDIFEVKNTRNILARDVVKDSGTTPYLCASKENNAVNSYINYNADFLDKGNCIFIGGKTFVVTYQQKDFYSNDSHNLALYLKDTHSKTKLNQLFVITCIYKALNNKYSWGDSISNTKIQNDSILLPTTQDGGIDFHFMHTLINALMKQTIQGVAQYCGAKIQATKEVISQEAPIQKDSLF